MSKTLQKPKSSCGLACQKRLSSCTRDSLHGINLRCLSKSMLQSLFQNQNLGGCFQCPWFALCFGSAFRPLPLPLLLSKTWRRSSKTGRMYVNRGWTLALGSQIYPCPCNFMEYERLVLPRGPAVRTACCDFAFHFCLTELQIQCCHR